VGVISRNNEHVNCALQTMPPTDSQRYIYVEVNNRCLLTTWETRYCSNCVNNSGYFIGKQPLLFSRATFDKTSL